MQGKTAQHRQKSVGNRAAKVGRKRGNEPGMERGVEGTWTRKGEH